MVNCLRKVPNKSFTSSDDYYALILIHPYFLVLSNVFFLPFSMTYYTTRHIFLIII